MRAKGLLTLDVVIPARNAASTLAECIEAVQRQTDLAVEPTIWVVDDASTDETSLIASRLAVRLLRGRGLGPGAARNEALARSRAEVVAFTDADCVPDRRWLAELLPFYADPRVGGVGGPILTLPATDEIGRFCQEHPPLVNHRNAADEFLPYLFTANASYRRELIDRVGGFREDLVTGQDIDLAWRIQIESSAEIRYAERAVIRHHARRTRSELARQYRRYGYGEVLLDSLYQHFPGYPRRRRRQLGRISMQLAALPRYAVSIALRRVRFWRGTASRYDATLPLLWLLIESSSIAGKTLALLETRFMTRPGPSGSRRRLEPKRWYG